MDCLLVKYDQLKHDKCQVYVEIICILDTYQACIGRQLNPFRLSAQVDLSRLSAREGLYGSLARASLSWSSTRAGLSKSSDWAS